jgi:hypothetical protein
MDSGAPRWTGGPATARGKAPVFPQSAVDPGVEGHVPDAIVESRRLATGDAVVSCRAVGVRSSPQESRRSHRCILSQALTA